MEPSFGRDGSLLGFRQAFTKEGIEQDQYLVLETSINGVGRSSPTGSSTIQTRGVRSLASSRTQASAFDAIDRAQDAAAERDRRVASRNEQTLELNNRVSALISQIAKKNVSSDPKELWSWWYEFNERERPAVRTARYVRLYDQSNYEIESSPTRAVSAECFVRGTLVTTQSGFKPIEKIVTGDLVLSKNVHSGELAWKPVIEATRRPKSTLLAIKARSDEFKCTPGHVFWVSGKGWRKASELIPGNILHSAKLPVAIEKISEASEAETFNLIVSEFANYFVGHQMILSHDYTSRSYASETIPGYRPE